MIQTEVLNVLRAHKVLCSIETCTFRRVVRGKCLGSGDPPGLQNRRSSLTGDGVFDSHALPPTLQPCPQVFARAGQVLHGKCRCWAAQEETPAGSVAFAALGSRLHAGTLPFRFTRCPIGLRSRSSAPLALKNPRRRLATSSDLSKGMKWPDSTVTKLHRGMRETARSAKVGGSTSRLP